MGNSCYIIQKSELFVQDVPTHEDPQEIAWRALDKSMKHISNRKSHEISRTETYSAHTALLILMRNPKEIEKDQYNEFYKNTFNEFLGPLANNQKLAKDTPKTDVSFDNSRDLCYERALIVCGRYKGDLPNTLKLRGIRADMTNSTIDIDVQQANDIPLIKILAKNQIDSYTTQAWFSQDKELEYNVAKISLETGTVSEYTHMVLLKTEPQAITSKSGKKRYLNEQAVMKQKADSSRGVYEFSDLNPYVGHPDPMREGPELFHKGLLSETDLALVAEAILVFVRLKNVGRLEFFVRARNHSTVLWGLAGLDWVFGASFYLFLKSKLQFIYLLFVSGQRSQGLEREELAQNGCNGEWGSQGGKIQIRKALGRTYIAFAVEEATKVKRTRKALLGITMRRMKLEVSFNGGKVINYISNAAHFVIMSFPGFHVEFDTIVKSNGQMKSEQDTMLAQAQQHIAMHKMALQIDGFNLPGAGLMNDDDLFHVKVVSADDLLDDGEYEDILEDMREGGKFGKGVLKIVSKKEDKQMGQAGRMSPKAYNVLSMHA
ncbi:hypothetical protein Tco_1067604 [Tanacetum coccineum]|uniref:Uncharacterized protein n=1 Tax=Tanacetum coccineum TaxID=301880 RepID=A0ABQ5HF17_9ASTR